jgi:hypothetical protein
MFLYLYNDRATTRSDVLYASGFLKHRLSEYISEEFSQPSRERCI